MTQEEFQNQFAEIKENINNLEHQISDLNKQKKQLLADFNWQRCREVLGDIEDWKNSYIKLTIHSNDSVHEKTIIAKCTLIEINEVLFIHVKTPYIVCSSMYGVNREQNSFVSVDLTKNSLVASHIEKEDYDKAIELYDQQVRHIYSITSNRY